MSSSWEISSRSLQQPERIKAHETIYNDNQRPDCKTTVQEQILQLDEHVSTGLD